MANEEQFLLNMYRESGDQVRNIEAIRGTFLSFFVVGVAAFTGFLSQGDAPRLVWWIVVVFAAIGMVGIVITWQYIQVALTRQRRITYLLLSPQVLGWLGLQALDERSIIVRIWTWRWWKGHRLDLFFLLTYLAFGGIATWFALCSDPFGFTTR